jgi:glycosyltransferase involved in cell wall biosynthesis
MKIVETFDGNYGEDPIRFLNFRPDRNIDVTFYVGLGSKINKNDSNKKFYLELEEPNRFCNQDAALKYTSDFIHCDKILTLCPYTAEYMNKFFYKRNVATPIFFPFNKDFISTQFNKKYSVIYSGYTQTPYHEQMLSIISKFKDRVIISYRPFNHVTHVNTSYKEKINLYAQTKIAVVSNGLINDRGFTLNAIQSTASKIGLTDIKNNYAFNFLETARVMPQLKSRVFEAAFGKCIILCQKDPFNVIERYFEPEKEFLYFDTLVDLEDKIKIILDNYAQYSNIAYSAFTKAFNNYTTDRLVKKIYEIHSNNNY